MKKVNKVDWDRFKGLTKKLIEFKAKLSKVPIRAESWEEIIYAVLLYMEYEVNWEVTSHAKGVDLEAKIDGKTLKISAKGGKIIDKHWPSLSSYRLTRFGFLGNMLKFLCENAEEIDAYLICAREEDRKAVRYCIFKLAQKSLAPQEMLNPINWEEDSQAWKLRANVGFEAKIVKKMSNQLWYSIPLDFSGLEELTTVEVSKSEIGSMMRKILKSLDR